MKLTVSTMSFDDLKSTLVYLDNKLIKTALSADDEEGWVEIIDPAEMAPLLEESDEVIDNDIAWSEIKTKRLYGKVEFRKLEEK